MKKTLIFIMLYSALGSALAWAQPQVVSSPLTPGAVTLLEQKLAQQNGWDKVHYLILKSIFGDNHAANQAKATLNSALPLLDRQINTTQVISTEAIRDYAQGYALWLDKHYLVAAEKITAYLTNTQMSPQGAFYSNGHIYAYENGLAILALANMYMVTGNEKYLTTAKNALLFLNVHRGIPGGGYSRGDKDYATPYLADNLSMGRALLALYQASANRNYLVMTEHVADFIIEHFKVENNTIDENARLAAFANLLYQYTGKPAYQTLTQEALQNIQNFITTTNYSPATLLSMNLQLSHEPAHITIVGDKTDKKALALYQAALLYPNFYKRIEWWDQKEGPLPNSNVMYPQLKHAAAFVCINDRCSLPIINPQKIVPLTQLLSQSKPAVKIKRIQPTLDTAVALLTTEKWYLLVLGFFGFGCLLAFTPCVLPMLPILASIIVGQGQKVTVAKAFFLSLVYVLSMSLTYALAGLITGYLGRYIQADLQNSWAISGFSVVFVLLALSLFGVYELELPKRLRHHVMHFSNQQKGGNYFGVAVMGCLSTLIASPCITPPLIGVLSYIAENGNTLLGGIALFSMGLGMGLPLLLAGTLGGKFLPKAGPWLDDVKIFFGFVLLGTAIWMLSRIFSENIILLMWVGLALAATIFLAFFTNPAATKLGRFSKIASIIAVMFGIILLTGSMINNIAPVTFNRYFPGNPRFQVIHNMNELQRALAKAQSHAKPVLLEYYAKWCTACNQMAMTTFRDKEVKKLMKSFVLLQADITNSTPDTQGLITYFGVIAPPTILFFDAQGKLLAFRIFGEVDAESFEQDLRGILTHTVQ